MSSQKEWKKPERHVPTPGAPLPPQLAELTTKTAEETFENLQKVPFFMKEIDEGENDTLEALKALAYDGDPEEIAENFKNQGNDNFKAKKYKDAVEFYDKALAVELDESKFKQLKIDLYNNRAASNLILKNYRKCINDCKCVLNLDEKNEKAIYRSGKAFVDLGRFDEAIACLEYGHNIAPDNKAIADLLASAKVRLAAQKEAEAKRRKEQELKETKARNREMAIEAKGITRVGKKSNKIKLVDEFDPSSDITMPTLFLYPLDHQSDIIEDADLNATLGQWLATIFEQDPAWFTADSKKNYAISNLEVYAPTITGGLVKVGLNSSILKVLTLKKPVIPVIHEIARFYVVPKNLAPEWLKNWNKDGALREMESDQ